MAIEVPIKERLVGHPALAAVLAALAGIPLRCIPRHRPVRVAVLADNDWPAINLYLVESLYRCVHVLRTQDLNDGSPLGFAGAVIREDIGTSDLDADPVPE